MVAADEAREAGFFKAVMPAGELLDAALAIANEIALNTAPVSVAMNRQLVWRMSGAAHPIAAHRFESRAIAARLAHFDSSEGVAAFAQKRNPTFEAGLEAASIMESWWSEE